MALRTLLAPLHNRKSRLLLLVCVVLLHTLLGLYLMRVASRATPLPLIGALALGTFFSFLTEIILIPLELHLVQTHLIAAFRSHFFHHFQEGTLASWHQLREETRYKSQWAASLLRTSFKRLVQMTIFGGALFFISLPLALLALPFFVLYHLPGFLFAIRTRKLREELFKREGTLYAYEARAQQARSLFRVQNWGAWGEQRFISHLTAFHSQDRRHRIWHSLLPPLLTLVTLSLVLVVWMKGSSLIQSKQLSEGGLYAFLTGLFLLYPVLSGIGRDFLIFFSLKRPLVLPTESDFPHSDSFTIPQKSLTVDNITFGFQESLFQHLNHEFKAGTITAVSGPNGSGKSTLLSLLLGLYLPQTGSILVDGKESLPSPFHLGFLDQNATLFDVTQRENILMGRSITHEASLFVSQEQKDNPSLHLSGGERKKIALERAFYQFPKLILLDEPDDSLDKETFAILLVALSKAKKAGSIIILTTHSSALMEFCDEILPIQK